MTGSRSRRLLFLSNAIDDDVRLQRGIISDSPAASRKIFMMLTALRQPGVYPFALSLGRGRRAAGGGYFPARVCRSRSYTAVYLPFSNRRWWSELLSLVAPAVTLWRLRAAASRTTVLFYNREHAYLLALLVARLLKYRTALDLEDGEIGCGTMSSRSRRWLFDRLCTGGALLACSALEKSTSLRPAMCYYGIVTADRSERDWNTPLIKVLLGGTLSRDTGVALLVQAVSDLRAASPAWVSALEIHITGKGEALPTLEQLAEVQCAPHVVFHGRMTDADYAGLLQRMHVGLALKLNKGLLAQTTFPSKVTELAGAGLLVVTTDISDVRRVLADGAIYLEHDDAGRLVDHLRAVVEDRGVAQAIAARGEARVGEICAPGPAGLRLAAHLFGTPA